MSMLALQTNCCFLHPELTDTTENETVEEEHTGFDDEFFYLRADIYSYAQVVAYTLTGNTPWQGRNSVSVQGIQNNLIKKEDRVELPEEVGGVLRKVIEDCRLENPEMRPTADQLVLEYFSGRVSKVPITLIYSHWQLLLVNILLNENFSTIFTQLELIFFEDLWDQKCSCQVNTLANFVVSLTRIE